MQRSTLYPIGAAGALALCGAIATCRPAPESPPAGTSSSTGADASGAGGAAATAEGAATSASSTSTGAPAAACEVRQPKHTACENPSDCYDSSSCSEEICDLATPPSPPDPFGRRSVV